MLELLHSDGLDIESLDKLSNSDLGEICKNLGFSSISRYRRIDRHKLNLTITIILDRFSFNLKDLSGFQNKHDRL